MLTKRQKARLLLGSPPALRASDTTLRSTSMSLMKSRIWSGVNRDSCHIVLSNGSTVFKWRMICTCEEFQNSKYGFSWIKYFQNQQDFIHLHLIEFQLSKLIEVEKYQHQETTLLQLRAHLWPCILQILVQLSSSSIFLI